MGDTHVQAVFLKPKDVLKDGIDPEHCSAIPRRVTLCHCYCRHKRPLSPEWLSPCWAPRGHRQGGGPALASGDQRAMV